MTAARNRTVGGVIGSYVTDLESLTTVDVTIADGQSLSPAVDIGAGLTIVGVRTPAGWTTAALSFQHALTLAGTYVEYNSLVTGLAVVTPSLVASGSYAAVPEDFLGVRFLKIRSGTVGTPVVQTGGDILTLVVRSVR